VSERVSYAFAIVFLLLGALFRLHDLALLPTGMSASEVDTVRIVETARAGTIETFYTLRGSGREPLYEIMVAALTAFTGTGLVGYRLLSVFAGLLTLALVYVLGKRLFGARAGLLALALLAVGWFPALLSRSILPEALLPLLTAATLVALAQSLSIYHAPQRRRPNTIAFAALGLLLGFGFYAHPLHFPLVLAVMLFIAYFVLTRQSVSGGELSFTSFGILIMIIVAMPYLIASLRQPELAGAGRLIVGAGGAPLDSFLSGVFGVFFRGDTEPDHNLPGRPLVDLLSGFIILMGVLVAARHWRQPAYALMLIPFVVLLPFSFIAPQSPDFTRYAPLLPLLALLFAAGIEALGRLLVGRRRALILSAGLLVLLAFNLQWTWRDLFVGWRALPEVAAAYHARIGQIAHYLDETAAQRPTVICTPELYPPNEAAQLIDAQLLALMMNRTDPQLRYADCGSGMILARGGAEMQVIFLQPGGLEATTPYVRRWIEQGQVLDTFGIPPNAVVRLDVEDALADTIGRFTTTAVASYPPETGLSDRIAEIPVRMGGNIAFLGYDQVPVTTFAPGAVVPIYTYWRVDGIVPTDLRLFTHLLSDPNVIAVQADTLSVRADLLEPRDVIVQATFIQLPFTIPSGTYIVSTGVYEANLGRRLGVFDGDQLRGDRLFIGTIGIVR
jgi:4-amino-4-deoxy-L-arabinose transferase-like glycosyltransferase